MTRKLRFTPIQEIADAAEPEILQTDINGFNQGGYLRANSGDLVFLGGRPSSGKTMLALQLAHFVSFNIPVLFFSLEMTAEQLKWRLRKRRANLKSSNLVICDEPGLLGNEISENIAQMATEGPVGLVVIDYVQIIQSNGRSKTEEIGAVVRELKGVANEMQIPILLIAQLSRDIEKRTAASEFAEPQMSDFADSSEIEKWADCCLMMHKIPKTDNITKVFCVKNRHGLSHNFELRLNPQNLCYEDVI
jgi:replicative DNA helicase